MKRKSDRIFRSFAAALMIAASAWSGAALRAEEASFSAQLDRAEISSDESVSLTLTLSSAGGVGASEPRFEAPDFEVVNQYSGTQIESRFENGRFFVRNNQRITQVLRPLRQGVLSIRNIRIQADGRTLSAPDLSVKVSAGGAGAQPPRGYGGGGVGLRGAGKRGGPGIFVRAELSKQRVYKGEQVVVSYYLYRKARVFNIQVQKYPVLSGFLREDLEMPVLGQQLGSEQVVLDGTPYLRSLLARYAAYPLQEGKLRIDSMALKFNYYAAGGGGGGDEDPNDPFFSFFQQMAPRTSSSESDQVSLEVLPLPLDGRPESFSGGVGDFTVSSAVDKYDVRANEAVSLTVKVEGRGNVASIGEPKAQWPADVELYDSKGRAKTAAGGVGEKVFEFVLIPRRPGKIEIPGIAFSFFDPMKRQYVTRSTDPIAVNVGEPAAGSAPAAQPAARQQGRTPAPATTEPAASSKGLSELRPPESQTSGAGGFFAGFPAWRWLYWLSGLGMLALIGLWAWDWISGRKAREANRSRLREKAPERVLDRLQRLASDRAPWRDITQAYEELSGVLLGALDRRYALGARSYSREALKEQLVGEEGLPGELWRRLSSALEYAELVCFAGAAAGVSEQAARAELPKRVGEARELLRELEALGEAGK